MAIDRESKDLAGHNKIFIGFSWNQYSKQYSAGAISGLLTKRNSEVDCDASAYMIRLIDGKEEVSECVDYENLKSTHEAVIHQGDDQNGGSSADDEMLEIDFGKMPADVTEIRLTLDLLKEKKKQLKIGKLSQVSVKIYDADKNEIARYDLNGFGDRVVQVGKIKRTGSSWAFLADIKSLSDVKDHSDVRQRILG